MRGRAEIVPDQDLSTINLVDVMVKSAKVSHPEMLADEALKLMESYKISALPVVDNNNRLLGAINTHDLLKAGII